MDSGNRTTNHTRQGEGKLITFDFVPLHLVTAEIAPNVERHYYEMTEGDDYGPPDIDWDGYNELSLAGRAFAAIIRDKGALVGYSTFAICENMRYKGRIEAFGQGIFIEKPYRSKYARKLVRHADICLSLLGVKETNYTLSDSRVGKMLESLGYKSTYTNWSRCYGKQSRETIENSSAACA